MRQHKTQLTYICLYLFLTGKKTMKGGGIWIGYVSVKEIYVHYIYF